MTWSDIGEIVKALAAVATALAAWFAAVTAYRGLQKWRHEVLGKQRVELATTYLRNVYEFAQVLRAAREPWVLPQEMVKDGKIPDHIAEDANYAPERRLLEHQEFFARFRSLKHEVAAVFGIEAATPIDALWRIRLDINHAVHDMLTNKEIGKSREPDDRKLWEGWYRTAFRHHKEDQDEVNKRIAAEIAAVEAICRPEIDASSRRSFAMANRAKDKAK